MRRIFWTLGMAIVGLFFGLKGQAANVDMKELAIATIWAGAIGYGFGSVFDQRPPGRRLIIYWAVTLALVGLFFGPLLPITSFITGQALGGVIGALAGALVGALQLRMARRRSQSPDAGIITDQRRA